MLKIREKPRKYHFFPRKSMFVFLNNSKVIVLSCEATKLLDTERLAALFAIQYRVEDHSRDEHRGKQVR